MYRTVLNSEKVAILAYPAPYRSWMAINSDPDHTIMENWRQVHAALWEELDLPFADTFFITSVNEVHANQVTLTEHPEILALHPHDTMHTWGDYVAAPSYTFDRSDAEQGLRRLRELNCSPLIWTDHSHFSGNLMHRASLPAVPVGLDASGHEYLNHSYSLDLIHEAGVRYVWDGTLVSDIWGQDRLVGRREWYRSKGAGSASLKRRLLPGLDVLLSPVKEYLHPAVFSYVPLANRQYYEKRFPDGQRFYAFPRFGRWELGDIDGLGELLAPPEIEKFIHAQGTAIVYSHLGKRNSKRTGAPDHVSDRTMTSLRNLAEKYRAGLIKLSATSELLDYLVLRDNLRVDGSRIEFRADPIRYPDLCVEDLRPHVFGVVAKGPGIDVILNGETLATHLLERGDGVYELRVE